MSGPRRSSGRNAKGQSPGRKGAADSLALYPRDDGAEGSLHVSSGARAHHGKRVLLQDVREELGRDKPTMALAWCLAVPRCPGSADHHHPVSSSMGCSSLGDSPGEGRAHNAYLSLPVRGVDENDILGELVIRDEDVVQLVIHSLPGNLETPGCPHKGTQHSAF